MSMDAAVALEQRTGMYGLQEAWENAAVSGGEWLCIRFNTLEAQQAARHAIRDAAIPAVALWQFRWTNPGDSPDQPAEMLAWQEIKPWGMTQTLEERIKELCEFQYAGKPAYEVRALYAASIAPQPPNQDQWQAAHEAALALKKCCEAKNIAKTYMQDIDTILAFLGPKAVGRCQ